MYFLLQNAPKRAKLDSAGKENLVAARSQKPTAKPAALAKRPASKPAAVKSATVSRKAPTAASKVTKPTAGAGGSSKAGAGKTKRAAWDVKGRLQVCVCLITHVLFDDFEGTYANHQRWKKNMRE